MVETRKSFQMTLFWAIVVLIFLLTIWLFMGPTSFYTKESHSMNWITGYSFKLMQAAVPEAERRGLDVGHYKIAVVYDKSVKDKNPLQAPVVVFIDVNAPVNHQARGNIGEIPGLEVIIDPKTLQVSSSNFIR